uniref:hypothetical protein n=1 Tax=Chromobacterium subtsugae TaxID=251747 RepID=UPI001C1162A8
PFDMQVPKKWTGGKSINSMSPKTDGSPSNFLKMDYQATGSPFFPLGDYIWQITVLRNLCLEAKPQCVKFGSHGVSIFTSAMNDQL